MLCSPPLPPPPFSPPAAPHTPVNWTRKRNKVLGNLSTFRSLLVQCLEVYLGGPGASCEATGLALVSIVSALFTNLALANTVREALASLVPPLAAFYQQAAGEPPKFSSQLLGKVGVRLLVRRAAARGFFCFKG